MAISWNDGVTLVNRTNRKLEVRADGETLVLQPHEEKFVPRFVADLACRQHPVMGTEDPYNPRNYEMLVGVKEWGHPVTPIEQSDAVERIARNELMDVEAKHAVVVGGRASKPVRLERSGLSNDAEFRPND